VVILKPIVVFKTAAFFAAFHSTFFTMKHTDILATRCARTPYGLRTLWGRSCFRIYHCFC